MSSGSNFIAFDSIDTNVAQVCSPFFTPSRVTSTAFTKPAVLHSTSMSPPLAA